MTIHWKMLAGVAFAAALGASAAAADPLAAPAMSGPITANPSPMSFDAGFGKIFVTGSVSGLAYVQSNATQTTPGDKDTNADLSGAMVNIQKTDGMFQFYIQAGLYSFPTVGVPYTKASSQNSAFGAVPVAYGKVQLTDTFSVQFGKLPTLVGAEYAFTTQNMNIERGLLWWQEPIVSRGAQVNYASGPLSLSVSLNDGFYTDKYNTVSGLISYAINPANTIAFDTSITPDASGVAGSQIYDLMYTYNAAPWVVGPYVQYQTVNNGGGSEWGIGALASYAFTPNWSLAGRVEYEATSTNGPILPYGPKSKAFSLTLTPTWQKGIFFARGEVSYAGLSDQITGFGTALNQDNQIRGLFEAGVVF